MNSLKDSAFSCRMLTRAMDVRWWGQLVENCIPNLDISVSKQSMEYEWSLVNQFKDPPFSEVGNTQHKTVLSEVTNSCEKCIRPCARQDWSSRRNDLCSGPST